MNRCIIMPERARLSPAFQVLQTMEVPGNEPVIMRFLEGDVPMMICSGDTVSGTRKREGQSEALGIADATTIQLRGALFNVANGTMTIDETIAAYGTFTL